MRKSDSKKLNPKEQSNPYEDNPVNTFTRQNCEIKLITDIQLPENLLNLDLSLNSITKIEGQPDTLIEQNLSSNKLTWIHGLDHLTNLTKLDLSHNQINMIEKLNQASLEELDMSYNAIKVFCGMEKCRTVKIVKMDHNEIESIYAPPANNKIEELGLSWNNLAKISDYEISTQQEQIEQDISHNRQEELTFLAKLKSLNTCDVSYNKLKKISNNIVPAQLNDRLYSSATKPQNSNPNENKPNIKGTLLMTRKSNKPDKLDEDSSIESCQSLYSLKMDHNFLTSLEGLEEWIPQISVQDISHNSIKGEDKLYFIYHQNYLAEIFFAGNDFYYLGIEERFAAMHPYLEVICGTKFCDLGVREKSMKKEITNFLLDTKLASIDEIKKIQSDYQSEIRAIDLSEEEKRMLREKVGEELQDDLVDKQFDKMDLDIKKKLYKKEMHHNLKANKVLDKDIGEDEIDELEESIDNTDKFAKFKDDYEQDFENLSNEIEAALEKMNSFFNEKVTDEFPALDPMPIKLESFHNQRKERDQSIKELNKNRLDNWPERVQKHNNRDYVLNPLRNSHLQPKKTLLTATDNSQLPENMTPSNSNNDLMNTPSNSTKDSISNGLDIGSKYLCNSDTKKTMESLEKTNAFCQNPKTLNFSKKNSEMVINTMMEDSRPVSAKSFRLRGSVGGMSAKTFMSNNGGFVGCEDLNLPMPNSKSINLQSITQSNQGINYKDPCNRAAALKKQNEQQKAILNKDKISFIDSNFTGSGLNPIKAPLPLPKVHLKKQFLSGQKGYDLYLEHTVFI